jgi:hypothetical protein
VASFLILFIASMTLMLLFLAAPAVTSVHTVAEEVHEHKDDEK